jgi:hypothetical protein
LLLVTNIPSANVTNLNLLIQKTKGVLFYKSGLTNQCLLSEGSSTNPSDFAGYSGNTDFMNLSSSYTYNPVYAGNNLLVNLTSGYVAISISNILIDCTVGININIGEGYILNDGFFNTFICNVNQNVEYI